MTIKFGLAAAVTLLLTCGLGAQEKKAKTVNYQGNVQGVNKSTSMILIKNGRTGGQSFGISAARLPKCQPHIDRQGNRA